MRRYEVVNEEHSRGYPWTVIERSSSRGFTMTTWHGFPDEASACKFARVEPTIGDGSNSQADPTDAQGIGPDSNGPSTTQPCSQDWSEVQ